MAFDLNLVELGKLYSRPQLADLWGYKSYHAIARGVVTPAGSRRIVLFVTREKQSSLTQYDDFLNGDQLWWEGEKGHGTDDRIARAHENGEQIHLFYRDVHHTRFRYHGQILLTLFERRKNSPSRFAFTLVHALDAEDDLRRHASEFSGLTETEQEAVVKARRGQGAFRAALFEDWKGCAVTGVEQPDLLRASHIKPWRYSTNDERLDRFNGLLLLPQYDHLFDRGYISFDEHGRMLPSPAITEIPQEQLGIDLKLHIRQPAARYQQFLEYHRSEIFVAEERFG